MMNANLSDDSVLAGGIKKDMIMEHRTKQIHNSEVKRSNDDVDKHEKVDEKNILRVGRSRSRSRSKVESRSDDKSNADLISCQSNLLLPGRAA